MSADPAKTRRLRGHASARSVLVGAALVSALVLLAGLGAWILQSTIPRRIVLASGAPDGLYHHYAVRYAQILARSGIKVEERQTAGAAENARLLADPKSGVDVAFMQGGAVPEADRDKMVMLAALYYEPLWIFYRGDNPIGEIDAMRYKRFAIGAPGQGVRAFLEPLLAANNITGFNTQLLPLANTAALRALQAKDVDAAAFVGGVKVAAIYQALHDPSLSLLSFVRADAYVRRFSYIFKLTLPAGTVDFGLRIPPQDATLIGTKAMLASRPDLSPAIIDLLYEAAREIHGGKGYFEAPREFPNTDPVDLPVSVDADRHQRFGPGLLHRHLPFLVATYLERLLIVLIPLLVLIVPLLNILPQILRWRSRSRIYRWYGELKLLERDVGRHKGEPPIHKWLADLDRIEAAAARIRTPPSYASEAYTLREHIALVRRNVMERASGARPVESGVSSRGAT